jgi:hypothetical protein
MRAMAFVCAIAVLSGATVAVPRRRPVAQASPPASSPAQAERFPLANSIPP